MHLLAATTAIHLFSGRVLDRFEKPCERMEDVHYRVWGLVKTVDLFCNQVSGGMVAASRREPCKTLLFPLYQ
jgi:hypothetical protein